MKKRQLTVEYRASQAIGSMAIDGIRVSPEIRDLMVRVASGELKGTDVRGELVSHYRHHATLRRHSNPRF